MTFRRLVCSWYSADQPSGRSPTTTFHGFFTSFFFGGGGGGGGGGGWWWGVGLGEGG